MIVFIMAHHRLPVFSSTEPETLLQQEIYNKTVSFTPGMITERWAAVQTILMGVDCRGSVGIYAPLGEYAPERPTASQR